MAIKYLNQDKQPLSAIIHHMKYARYLPEAGRREAWEETVERNKQMHLQHYADKIKDHPQLGKDIIKAYDDFVLTGKVLPSMRSFQFGGQPIEINPARIYNCSFFHIDHPDAFSEGMFLLLSGVGTGYSVQKHHVEKLPGILGVQKQEPRRYLVADSIEGWADAVKTLVESYFYGKAEVEFDLRGIRPKGARLITSGGKAPGPEPLRQALVKIRSIFENALQDRGFGTKLKPIEAHDIMCHIADAVLSGGIRRAAMISLFNFNDEEMLEAKFGNWWENNPQRGRANNSAVAVRDKITEEDFWWFWKKVEASKAGEPGIFFTNDSEWGLNPCAEISLRTNQFCNLTTMNAATIESQEDLEERVWAATLLGTLQAGYTNFHYLRSSWKKTTEKEALLGVSMTGVASGKVLSFDLKKASSLIKGINKEYAAMIGINPAARLTSIKPEGTTSLLLGTSSGMHAWHNDYYLRRVRVNKNEAIYAYLSTMYPELLEEDFFSPQSSAIITVPQKAPDGAILRTETAIDALERLKTLSMSWIRPGHAKGKNRNNVSCTISVKDNEWNEVGTWMWQNREHYTAIAVLPYDGGTYVQAPFEDLVDGYVITLDNKEVLRGLQPDQLVEARNASISEDAQEIEKLTVSELANHINGYQVRDAHGTFRFISALRYMTKKEQYEILVQHLNTVDVSHVPELEDNTHMQAEIACGGGACEVA